MKFVKLLSIGLSLLFFHSAMAQGNSLKSYNFGHSLVAHTMGDQSIPHWFYLLSAAAGQDYSVDGQYGFLPLHNLPPSPQWGFEIVPSAWQTNFADTDFDNVIITAANFIQYQPPNGLFLGTNTITETLRLFDYVRQEEPGIPFYIYENFPEFNSFPPTPAEFADYHNITRTSFHDWWIELQDSTNLARPGAEIKLIPAGYILAGMLTEIPGLDTIPATELYEDGDPHGEAVLYFLLAMIHYSAINMTMPPAGFNVPAEFPESVADHYEDIRTYIWDELTAFNYANGSSRVFLESTLPVDLISFELHQKDQIVQLEWQTAQEVNHQQFDVEHSEDGLHFQKIETIPGSGVDQLGLQAYTFAHQPNHRGWQYYRLQQIDRDGTFTYSPVRSIYLEQKTDQRSNWYPNPASSDVVRLDYWAKQVQDVQVELYDPNGRLMVQKYYELEEGNNSIQLNLRGLNSGIYFIAMLVHGTWQYQKLYVD